MCCFLVYHLVRLEDLDVKVWREGGGMCGEKVAGGCEKCVTGE